MPAGLTMFFGENMTEVISREQETLHRLLDALGLRNPEVAFIPVDREWNLPPESTFSSNTTVYFFTADWERVLELPRNLPIMDAFYKVKVLPGTSYTQVRYIVILSAFKNTVTVYYPQNQSRFDVPTMELLYARRTLR